MFRQLKDGLAIPVSMGDCAVARVVQARVVATDHDPVLFAEHLLRAGYIRAGARFGTNVFKLKEVSRHESTDVLASYVRDTHIPDDHAGEKFL